MRKWVIIVTFALACGNVYGQRHKLGEVNAEKPEGQLLQHIGQENDATKKIALMEQFVAQYPKHEAAGWVLEQLQAACVKANLPDKAIDAGEKLVALDPDDTEAALQTLKAWETKNDADQIRKWSGITSAAAKKLLAAPQPSGAKEAEAWKNQVEYARQVDAYTEYALFRAALENPDPKRKIEMGEALEQRNPKSEYMVKVATPLFLAYRQTGANDKAVALAEKVLAVDQSNEDMLAVVADNYLQTKKHPDKVHAYSSKIVEVLSAKPKPEGMSDADWTTRKNLLIGLAHYMDGKLYYTESNFAGADKSLRQALPLAESNAALKPEILYLLGYANYKLDKAQDAANFYRTCAAIKSPYQALANKNLLGIRNQYKGIK